MSEECLALRLQKYINEALGIDSMIIKNTLIDHIGLSMIKDAKEIKKAIEEIKNGIKIPKTIIERKIIIKRIDKDIIINVYYYGNYDDSNIIPTPILNIINTAKDKNKSIDLDTDEKILIIKD